MAFFRATIAATILLLSAAATLANACRYDTEYCSCKLGNNRSGTCWDKLGTTGNCHKRFCRAGFACSCAGASHLCRMERRTAHIPLNARAKSSTAACRARTIYAAGKPVLKLGTLTISISPKGSLNDACNEVAVWHNGNLISNLGKEPVEVKRHPQNVLLRRTTYRGLELRPGDIIAFRFFDASYYCFRHRISLVVNGKAIGLNSPGMQNALLYSRKASPGWNSPNFDPYTNMATSESTADLTKWHYPRKTMLTSPNTIVPNEDYWAPADQSNADNRIANFYWRLKVAS